MNTRIREIPYNYTSFSDKEIELTARKYKAPFQRVENFSSVAKTTAQLLANGKVIGWFQGNMEFGPRALGRRSILGDARNPEMQKKLNLKIKYRIIHFSLCVLCKVQADNDILQP